MSVIGSQDARQRTKAWLDNYLDASNINKLDSITPCQLHVAYANPLYPIKLVFKGDIGNDVEFAVHDPKVKPLIASNKSAYGYVETVPIEIDTVDKDTTVSGYDAQWKSEKELRRIAELYGHDVNLRTFETMEPASKNMGGWTLYSKICNLTYKRASLNYASGVTVTWGPSDDPTGTYTLPNITYISNPLTVNNTRLTAPGRRGNILQKLGCPDYAITIRCDLDVEKTTCTWKRPQTTTPKTDILPHQIFMDILFNGAVDEEYQTLDLGWGGSLKVTLEEVTPVFNAEESTVELLFYVYNSASATAYKDFFGINP